MESNLKNIQTGDVDIVFYNGVIYTADRKDTLVEALALKNGVIIFTGSNEDIKQYLHVADEAVDLRGKMVLPGFIDSHLHVPGRALTDLYNISLYEAQNLQSILVRIEEFIEYNPDLEIYYGEGFSLGHFSGEEISRGPRKEHLDSICPSYLRFISSIIF